MIIIPKHLWLGLCFEKPQHAWKKRGTVGTLPVGAVKVATSLSEGATDAMSGGTNMTTSLVSPQMGTAAARITAKN